MCWKIVLSDFVIRKSCSSWRVLRIQIFNIMRSSEKRSKMMNQRKCHWEVQVPEMDRFYVWHSIFSELTAKQENKSQCNFKKKGMSEIQENWSSSEYVGKFFWVTQARCLRFRALIKILNIMYEFWKIVKDAVTMN